MTDVFNYSLLIVIIISLLVFGIMAIELTNPKNKMENKQTIGLYVQNFLRMSLLAAFIAIMVYFLFVINYGQ